MVVVMLRNRARLDFTSVQGMEFDLKREYSFDLSLFDYCDTTHDIHANVYERSSTCVLDLRSSHPTRPPNTSCHIVANALLSFHHLTKLALALLLETFRGDLRQIMRSSLVLPP